MIRAEECQSFIDSADLGEVREIALLAGGAANTVYRLETSGGRFVLKVWDDRTPERALHVRRLAGVLEAAGIPVAAPLAFEIRGGKAWELMPFVEGEFLPRGEYPQLGALLAKLHGLPVPEWLPREYPMGARAISDLCDRVEREPGLIAGEDRPMVPLFRRCLDRLAPALAAPLPLSILHGDLTRENVLWRDGEIVALIDLEDTFAGPGLLDLALAGITGSPAVRGGYRRLSALEESLYPEYERYAALALVAWCFQRFHVGAPPELRDQDPHQDLLPYLEGP